MILETELTTYEQNRDQLLGTAEGTFVLIHDHQVIDILDSKMVAIAAGYQQFGKVPFLAKQILKIDVPLTFIFNVCTSPVDKTRFEVFY